jgi:hypothetical protein
VFEEQETDTQWNDWSSVFWRYVFGDTVSYLPLQLVLCHDTTVVACDIISSLETVLQYYTSCTGIINKMHLLNLSHLPVLSVHLYFCGSHWTDFHEILYW